MSEVKNTDVWVFIDKSATATASYVRLGLGISGLNPANNPIVDTKHYINAKNPTTKILGTQKQMALTMERYKGDDANDYIAGLAEKTGEDVETSVVIVDHLDAGAVTAKPAKKYMAVVAVGSEGNIQGGAPSDMDVTIYCNGDPIVGKFNETSKEFTADA